MRTTTSTTTEAYVEPEMPQEEVLEPDVVELEDTPSCRSPPPCEDPNTDLEMIHRDPCDCKKFYRCAHNQAQEFTCMDGLVFSTKIQTCDWPTNVAECRTYYLKQEGGDEDQENRVHSENEVDE